MPVRFASRLAAAAGLVALGALPALASDGLDTGDTAWIMSATALVLFMTCRAWRCSMPGWCRRRTSSRC